VVLGPVSVVEAKVSTGAPLVVTVILVVSPVLAVVLVSVWVVVGVLVPMCIVVVEAKVSTGAALVVILPLFVCLVLAVAVLVPVSKLELSWPCDTALDVKPSVARVVPFVNVDTASDGLVENHLVAVVLDVFVPSEGWPVSGRSVVPLSVVGIVELDCETEEDPADTGDEAGDTWEDIIVLPGEVITSAELIVVLLSGSITLVVEGITLSDGDGDIFNSSDKDLSVTNEASIVEGTVSEAVHL